MTHGIGVEATAPEHQGSKSPGRPVVVTTRSAKRGIFFSRRMLVVANAMVVIAFALGYLLHPM